MVVQCATMHSTSGSLISLLTLWGRLHVVIFIGIDTKLMMLWLSYETSDHIFSGGRLIEHLIRDFLAAVQCRSDVDASPIGILI